MELNLRKLERQAMREALRQTRGNVGQAARLLGCSIRKLQYHCRSEWGLTPRELASRMRAEEIYNGGY